MSQEIINQALALIKQKELAAARSLLEPLLRAEPANEVAWLVLAETCQSEPEKRKIYEQCLEHVPAGEHGKKALARLGPKVPLEESQETSTTTRQGGIDVSGGDIHLTDGSIIGRDQINQTIHYINITGQVLSLAQIQGLLPKESNPLDFSDIYEAIQSFVSEHDNNYLVDATVRAGKILAPVLEKIKVDPTVDAAPAPISVLYDIDKPLGYKLTELKYWVDYSEPFTQKELIPIPTSDLTYFSNMSVIWLRSTKEVWRRYLKENYLFGLLKYDESVWGRTQYAFLGKKLDTQKKTPSILQQVKNSIKPSEAQQEEKYDFTNLKNSNLSSRDFRGNLFDKFTFKQRRLFLFGLTIDLIRLSSQVIKDLHEDSQLASSLGNISTLVQKNGVDDERKEQKN